jgi:hypothetical protein
MGDQDRYEQLSRVSTDRILAWRAAHPEDGEVVDRVLAFRAEVWDKRIAADRAVRAADRAAREDAAEAEQARLRQAAEAKAERRRQELAALGAGRCPHGNLLEECDYLSCAPDPDKWVRHAMSRNRYCHLNAETRRRQEQGEASLEDKDG